MLITSVRYGKTTEGTILVEQIDWTSAPDNTTGAIKNEKLGKGFWLPVNKTNVLSDALLGENKDIKFISEKAALKEGALKPQTKPLFNQIVVGDK